MSAWTPCAPLDPSRDSAALARQYLAALEGFDTTLLDRSDNARHVSHGLSGLFLPSVPSRLPQASHRIMIVGAETKGWAVLKKGEPMNGLAGYVNRAMTKHDGELHARLTQTTQDRGRSFMNFVRAVATQSGPAGVIWANLFCCDWKKKSPIKSPHYEMVRHYSALLLKAQVEFFAPSIIIFANGIVSAPARRAMFSIEGPGQVCTNGVDYHASHQIPNKQLWQFDLYGKTRCYRIQHPSSREDGATEARRFLLTLLPQA